MRSSPCWRSGAEIYLKSLRRYVEVGKTVSFRTVVAAARKRGETAIGYRKAVWSKGDGTSHGGVLNAPKSARLKVEAPGPAELEIRMDPDGLEPGTKRLIDVPSGGVIAVE